MANEEADADLEKKMEEFVDEEATKDKKEHEGFRQRLQQSKNFMTVILMVLVIFAVSLAVILPDGQSPRSVSLAETAGQDFLLGATMSKYATYQPTYQGSNIDPAGTVTLIFDDDDHFLVDLTMTGLEQYCEECKMRVHSATSCNDPPGAAYWNHNVYPNNPWDHVHYTASNGMTRTAVTAITGHGPHNILDHVFVVYDKADQPMACGHLRKDTSPRPAIGLYANVNSLPVYTQDTISGAVAVEFFEDDTFLYTISLAGLPPRCEKCRVGIQEGTSCENIGSHYFDHVGMERDPWATARGAYYTSGPNGRAERSFFLYSGYGHELNKGHAVLIHAADGTRIGCGILDTKKINIASAK